MNIRSKLIASALGLVVAAGAIGDVSAKTIIKTGAHGTTTTKIVAHRPHRQHVGTRIIENVRFAHRAPLRTHVVTVIGRRPVVAPIVARPVVVTKTVVARPLVAKIVKTRIVRGPRFLHGRIVHVAKRPLLERHAMNHHGKTTIIR